MAKKQLKSGLKLQGIAPNILLKDILNTAPYLFTPQIKSDSKKEIYIKTLKSYKKNLKLLNHLNLHDYFYLCLAAHWSTAGSYVPTNVDNQIRMDLWKHPQAKKFIEKMVETTIEARFWDYSQLTQRVLKEDDKILMSTHEGTWFSVAIGAYCAALTHGRLDLAERLKVEISSEIANHEKLLATLIDEKKYISLIKSAPLFAHNFGDLDRVMLAWDMHAKDDFCKSIYKLAHIKNERYSNYLVFLGSVNKEFTSPENHRHISLRAPRALRKSNEFLIHVGPFLDDWGKIIGKSSTLSLSEKAEIIIALYQGSLREKQAIGYARGLTSILKFHPLQELEEFLSFDVLKSIKNSKWFEITKIPQQEFEDSYQLRLKEFKCPKSAIQL